MPLDSFKHPISSTIVPYNNVFLAAMELILFFSFCHIGKFGTIPSQLPNLFSSSGYCEQFWCFAFAELLANCNPGLPPKFFEDPSDLGPSDPSPSFLERKGFKPPSSLPFQAILLVKSTIFTDLLR